MNNDKLQCNDKALIVTSEPNVYDILMDILAHYVQQGVSFIVPLIILLGLLIFVHELGHFLVAKYCGVRVEVFSLGFGKKFFKFKRGDTEYCISLIPFGGYVKMYGDDPTADVPDDMKKVSFLNKTVGQRIAIVLAGPLMNFFFAILLFFAIALIGEKLLSPVVGDINPSSEAYKMGFQTYDEIETVNGTPVYTWNDVKTIIEKNNKNPIEFKISRKGQGLALKGTTTLTENKNVLKSESHVGHIEGLDYTFKGTMIGVFRPELTKQTGLKTNDIITAIGQEKVTRWVELIDHVNTALEEQKETLSLKIKRSLKNDKTTTETIEIPIDPQNKSANDLFFSLGIGPAELFISKVMEDSAALAAGIEKGDMIWSVNDIRILGWTQLVKTVRSFNPDKIETLNITVYRKGDLKKHNITPKKTSQTDPMSGKEKKAYALGILGTLSSAKPMTFIHRTNNPIIATKEGIIKTLEWTKNICVGFLRLIQNKVSTKSIGGPIMIGQLASETFKIGIVPFLKIMAIISLNLFILNLLPIPVLDGGHLVFFIIEALRGAPLSMRKMEIAQQVGLILLLCLMVLALFNDILRVFSF